MVGWAKSEINQFTGRKMINEHGYMDDCNARYIWRERKNVLPGNRYVINGTTAI